MVNNNDTLSVIDRSLLWNLMIKGKDFLKTYAFKSGGAVSDDEVFPMLTFLADVMFEKSPIDNILDDVGEDDDAIPLEYPCIRLVFLHFPQTAEEIVSVLEVLKRYREKNAFDQFLQAKLSSRVMFSYITPFGDVIFDFAPDAQYTNLESWAFLSSAFFVELSEGDVLVDPEAYGIKLLPPEQESDADGLLKMLSGGEENLDRKLAEALDFSNILASLYYFSFAEDDEEDDGDTPGDVLRKCSEFSGNENIYFFRIDSFTSSELQLDVIRHILTEFEHCKKTPHIEVMDDGRTFADITFSGVIAPQVKIQF